MLTTEMMYKDTYATKDHPKFIANYDIKCQLVREDAG